MSLPGFKEMNIADSGAGKTHVLRTLLACGIQPLVLATEPGMRALAPCDSPACQICVQTRKFTDPIPYAYVSPAPGDIDVLIKQAETINKNDLKFLCSQNDPNRKDFDQFVKVLQQIKNFTDSNGKSWGPVHKWNTDRALVIDTWTQLGPMAMNLFCGRRPAYDKADYQIAQRALENFNQLITCSLQCHVIVNAHPEREFNEATSTAQLTISTVGAKLSPKLPPLYDDVFLSKRDGDKFVWTTAELNVVSKGRNLPIRRDIVPGYGQIVESWKRAGGVIEPTVIEVPTQGAK